MSCRLELMRVKSLRDLLEIQYEKVAEFRKAVELTDSYVQKISLRQQLQREVLPNLIATEKEYASLLALVVSSDHISPAATDVLLAQITTFLEADEIHTVQTKNIELEALLKDLRNIMKSQENDSIGKLKLALPIIPVIASYELEVELKNPFSGIREAAKQLLEGCFDKIVN